MSDEERLALAARVRDACIAAALAGHEEAAIAGLCSEGALEAAISAIQMLDLEGVIDTAAPKDP